jgi:hypothetical protein
VSDPLGHRGQHPGEAESRSAYAGTLSLLEIACGELPIPLMALDLADHTLSDPFVPRKPSPIEPTHWMAIPKLSGEEELERLEAAERNERHSALAINTLPSRETDNLERHR